ncbi:SRPBCC family protein [Nocardia sp. R7R-8]|uniref:SRPBCC family protein n=1 Tax=Nocardia sp. R7R-8 TaxID=3459304 RepID=UPI00403D5850
MTFTIVSKEWAAVGSGVLRRGESIAATTVVRATPQAVYDVVSDIRRIPSWSPECVRCEWIDDTTFRGTNKRRFGRWTTTARVTAAEPGREFTFVVSALNADFTRWSYRMERHPEGCQLTEEFQMCIDLPFAALAFERVALGVRDRRQDLRGNIDHSLRRIRRLVEAEQQRDRSETTVGES